VHASDSVKHVSGEAPRTGTRCIACVAMHAVATHYPRVPPQETRPGKVAYSAGVHRGRVLWCAEIALERYDALTTANNCYGVAKRQRCKPVIFALFRFGPGVGSRTVAWPGPWPRRCPRKRLFTVGVEVTTYHTCPRLVTFCVHLSEGLVLQTLSCRWYLSAAVSLPSVDASRPNEPLQLQNITNALVMLEDEVPVFVMLPLDTVRLLVGPRPTTPDAVTGCAPGGR
jgi:hypothetical protein